MQIREIYYIPIYPLNVAVLLVLNYLILKNTPENELCSLSEEEYMEKAMIKCEEVYFKPFVHILDILATICWVIIIKWLFF